MLFAKFWRGQCRVFSKDILNGGNIVYLVGVLSFGKYTIITANLKGGKTAVKGGRFPPFPPLENSLLSFIASL